MSLSASDLFLDRASLPPAEAVVRKVAEQGHRLAFPAGFSLADERHSGWLTVVVDGEKSGFDYQLFSRPAYEGDDAQRSGVPDHGDAVLAFAARHDQGSMLAMALVQRAICELSDAQGWWHEGEERFSNEEMIAFCTATIEAIRANPQPVLAAPSRFGRNYFRDIGKVLIGGGALMALAAILISLMGYFFAPGASQ